MTQQLRDIIRARGLTAYSLGKSAAVDHRVIDRFLRGERGITGETFDRLAAALGLRLEDRIRKGQPAQLRPLAEQFVGIESEAGGPQEARHDDEGATRVIDI